MKSDFSIWTETAMNRLGSRYIPVSVILIQTISFFTAPALLISHQNAQFNAAQFQAALVIWLITYFITAALVATWAFFANRDACKRLNDLVRGNKAETQPIYGIKAWHQVNSISLRYIPISVLLGFVGQALPLLIYLSIVFQISASQILYTLLGTLATIVAGSALAVPMLDRLMYPARVMLAPDGFEEQLKGISRLGLGTKLLGISVALILLSILLIAPIGYRYIAQAGVTNQAAEGALLSYQIESVAVSTIVLLVGLLLGYLMVRSLTVPIREMIQTFQMIEQGDLSKRISFSTTDDIGELAIYFNHMIERLAGLQESLELQVEDRTAHLNATIQVANAVSAILDIDELTERVVSVIANEFGYYYVALFLTESSGKWAELRAATGDAGRLLRANKHRLEINGRSMVGRAIIANEPIVAMDTGEGHIRFDNPLLPYTRSEIALPLIVGDNVLGALDAQSTREADFEAGDIETLKTVAYQIAVALENARLYQSIQKNLQDMQAIQRQYLLTSWEHFADENGSMGYEIGESEPGEAVSEIGFPLTLRDQPIGNINITSEKAWTPEELSMIEAIAAQATLALENARLVEDGQTSARRERLVTEITGKIWASTTVDGILQTVVRELGRALDTDEVIIELKADK